MSERLRRQIGTLHWTMESGHITDWSVAVDCGAHEGYWSRSMAERFGRVIAFEPSRDNYIRARQTVGACSNVELYERAVLDGERPVRLMESESKHSASRHVALEVEGDLLSTSIDALELPSCGLIKLDVEGAEFEALSGAWRTIKRFRPVLIVELKNLETRFGHQAGSVRQLLGKMHYRQVFTARPDAVFVASAR